MGIDDLEEDLEIQDMPPPSDRPKKKRALIEFGNNKENAWNKSLFGNSQLSTNSTTTKETTPATVINIDDYPVTTATKTTVFLTCQKT